MKKYVISGETLLGMVAGTAIYKIGEHNVPDWFIRWTLNPNIS
jgi:hypothetical protein